MLSNNDSNHPIFVHIHEKPTAFSLRYLMDNSEGENRCGQFPMSSFLQN
jgi:hypothetical protein